MTEVSSHTHTLVHAHTYIHDCSSPLALYSATLLRYMQGKPNASDATVKNNGMAPHHALSKGLEEAPSLSDDMQVRALKERCL